MKLLEIGVLTIRGKQVKVEPYQRKRYPVQNLSQLAYQHSETAMNTLEKSAEKSPSISLEKGSGEVLGLHFTKPTMANYHTRVQCKVYSRNDTVSNIRFNIFAFKRYKQGKTQHTNVRIISIPELDRNIS